MHRKERYKMSPDQVLALKLQGVDDAAIAAQHAMDIANEQGVDMGAAMAKARREIQSIDADSIAGTTAQEGGALGSPIRAAGIGGYNSPPMLDKVLNYDPAAPTATPYRSPSADLYELDRIRRAGLSAQEGGALGSPTLPLGGISAMEGMGLGSPSRPDVVPTASDLQNLLMTSPDQLGMTFPTTAVPPKRIGTDIGSAGISNQPVPIDFQQDALMDMTAGMTLTPEQKYAAKYGDPSAYNVTGGNLIDENAAAMAALPLVPTVKQPLIMGDAGSYDRLKKLGFTTSQAIAAGSPLQTVLQRPDLNLDIDAAMEATGGVPSAKPKAIPTALASESQPFGGGAKGSEIYTDLVNMKLQNTKINNQIAAYENAMENTQGNTQWQLDQLKSFKFNQPEGFNLLTDAQQLAIAKDKANKFKTDASSAVDEWQDTIADNPTNNEILNAQLSKNKIDRTLKALVAYGQNTGDLGNYENLDLDFYVKEKVDLNKINKIINKVNTNAFDGFTDSTMLESFQDEMKQIETDTAKEKQKSADQILIDKAKLAKDKADAAAGADSSPANTAAAKKATDNYNNAVTQSGASLTTTGAATGGAVTTGAVTPATTTGTATTGAATTGTAATTGGALGAGMGGAFDEFVDPRSRADIISDIEATPYGRGYQQVLAQLSSNLPVTALTPQYESYLQRNVLPQMQTAFEAGGAGMAGTQFAPTAGSPFSAFEQFVRGGGGRLSSQGYQDLINEANQSLQAQAPTDRQAYLQSLYANPEAQRNLYAQGLKSGASGAVGDVIDRMVNRRYMQQQFQAPTTAFLPTAMTPRTAYQTPSAIVGSGMVEDTDPFFDYRQTTANPIGAGTGGFGSL